METINIFKQLINDAASELAPDVRSSEAVRERLSELADFDVDARGPWKMQTAPEWWLTRHFRREVCLRAFEVMARDEELSPAGKIAATRDYLYCGRLPKQYYGNAFDELCNIATGLETGDIVYHVEGSIAMIVSEYTHVLRLGFCLAPIVICLNPHFRFGGKTDILKITVTQWRRGYCDLAKVWENMNLIEPGWGGNDLVGGSPRGQSTTCDIITVYSEVRKQCCVPWWQRVLHFWHGILV